MSQNAKPQRSNMVKRIAKAAAKKEAKKVEKKTQAKLDRGGRRKSNRRNRASRRFAQRARRIGVPRLNKTRLLAEATPTVHPGAVMAGAPGFSARRTGVAELGRKMIRKGNSTVEVVEVEFGQFVSNTIKVLHSGSDSTVSFTSVLSPRMFAQFYQKYGAIYELTRLMYCSWEYVPMTGTNTTGLIAGAYDYMGNETGGALPTTLAGLSIYQDVKFTNAYQPCVWTWKSQDDDDSEFCNSYNGYAFSGTAGTYADPYPYTRNMQTFFLVGQGFPVNTSTTTDVIYGQMYLYGVVQFTGRTDSGAAASPENLDWSPFSTIEQHNAMRLKKRIVREAVERLRKQREQQLLEDAMSSLSLEERGVLNATPATPTIEPVPIQRRTTSPSPFGNGLPALGDRKH